MGLFTFSTPSTSSIAFTIVILFLAFLAYLLNLKRGANTALVILLLLWLIIPLSNLARPLASVVRHFLLIPTVLILYFGRGNKEASFWGNLATGIASLVSHRFPDKISFLQKSGARPPLPCPRTIDCERLDIGDFRLELFSQHGSSPDKLIYSLHGASNITPLTNVYRKFNHQYARLFPNTVIASVDPRSALTHPYPATLDDVVAGYQAMLSRGFDAEDIVLIGDAAGANLALSLCHRLKDKGFALPKAIVLVSPQTDLTQSGESYVTRYHLDPILGNLLDQAEDGKRIPIFYSDDLDLTHPYISSLFGDFSGFPPTLIQVGEYEILYDDSKQLYEKMKKAGVDVKLTEFPGMVHSFQLMFTNWIPEVRTARDEIEAFLRKYLD